MTLTLLALCVSQRFALVTLAAIVVVLVGVAGYVSWLQPGYPHALLAQDQRILAQKHFPNWIRVIAVPTAVTLAVILSLGFLVRRLEEALAHNASLFGKLQAESQEKIDALEARHSAESQAKRAHELQLLGMLSASVAHDFNNLLMVILGNASLLKDDARSQAPAQTQAQLAEIEQAGERAAACSPSAANASPKPRSSISTS